MNGVGNGNGFDLVQKCPHEGDGAFIVQGDMWKVGQRYELIRVLGKGSFSVVCLAHDKQTKDLVALKKIKDVFVHKNNAKNVIREVYIQRRLRHPNVVELLDLIMMPSPTGKWKLVNGKLVTDSVDLYLVLECADGGDLFQLGEQLDQGEVIHIMKQLLVAVEFLHSCGVIHRDIKTANILIKTMPGTGKKTVKLADFGCARVAASSGAAHKASPGKRMARNRSYEDLPDSPTESEAETLASAMMTTAVATPCYRAPEVVMSLESYTSKVDIWSLGCILAELLARWLSHSKGYCKHTRVLPLFNLSTQPRVLSGVAWDDGDGATMAHRELRTVFEVIGTPAWHLVDKIGDPRWRKFLQCLPGHAPTLMRRFHGVNEVCLDLLRRMLEFDPQSRCGATEALTHEYFAEEGGAEGEDRVTGEFNVLHSKDKEAFDRLESELEALLRDEEDTHALKLKQILDNEIEEHQTCRGEEGWEPVAIASPGLRKLNLGKSAAVLSSYPHTTHTKVQQNEIGEDAHEEITRSYHESQGQGSPRKKKEVSFLDDGRHKDWTTFSSCTQEPHWSRTKEAEPVWGVSTVIPGSTHSASEQQSRSLDEATTNVERRIEEFDLWYRNRKSHTPMKGDQPRRGQGAGLARDAPCDQIEEIGKGLERLPLQNKTNNLSGRTRTPSRPSPRKRNALTTPTRTPRTDLRRALAAKLDPRTHPRPAAALPGRRDQHSSPALIDLSTPLPADQSTLEWAKEASAHQERERATQRGQEDDQAGAASLESRLISDVMVLLDEKTQECRKLYSVMKQLDEATGRGRNHHHQPTPTAAPQGTGTSTPARGPVSVSANPPASSSKTTSTQTGKALGEEDVLATKRNLVAKLENLLEEASTASRDFSEPDSGKTEDEAKEDGPPRTEKEADSDVGEKGSAARVRELESANEALRKANCDLLARVGDLEAQLAQARKDQRDCLDAVTRADQLILKILSQNKV